ncbi:RNA polymerase sigma factor [Aquimarina sp. 2304DJ70-9]|uniref:RNA polymerase sigma factor n=1 Tax=Aquimarina penaris TaxID=3231044 RepID=UPI003461A5E0
MMHNSFQPNELNPCAWIDLYHDNFIIYTIKRIDDYELAKDIVQETFIAAFRSVPNYKGKASERTWLISILKRKIIDYYRKRNTRQRKTFVLASYIQREEHENWLEKKVVDSSHKTLYNNLDSNHLKLKIQSAIKKLPQKQAQAISLKIRGWGTQEICEELEISKPNLWVMIHRARQVLKNELKEHLY